MARWGVLTPYCSEIKKSVWKFDENRFGENGNVGENGNDKKIMKTKQNWCHN